MPLKEYVRMSDDGRVVEAISLDDRLRVADNFHPAVVAKLVDVTGTGDVPQKDSTRTGAYTFRPPDRVSLAEHKAGKKSLFTARLASQLNNGLLVNATGTTLRYSLSQAAVQIFQAGSANLSLPNRPANWTTSLIVLKSDGTVYLVPHNATQFQTVADAWYQLQQSLNAELQAKFAVIDATTSNDQLDLVTDTDLVGV